MAIKLVRQEYLTHIFNAEGGPYFAACVIGGRPACLPCMHPFRSCLCVWTAVDIVAQDI